MKAFLVLATVVLGTWAFAQDAPLLRTFDTDQVDSPPPGFTFAQTRETAPSRWTVRREASGHVLAHLQEGGPAGGFALAVLEPVQGPALRISARLKAGTGRRTAGIVWSYQDPANYHVAWLDLSEQRVGIYRFNQGNRIRLRAEDDLELDPDAWHTMTVVSEPDEVRMYLGGIKVFESRRRGAVEPGRVGVWSADDTLAYFDDFRAEPVRNTPRR